MKANLFMCSLIWAWACARAAAPQQTDGDVSWTELLVQKEGKTGFTWLSPEQTGVHFTNTLDEWSSAANRVLENGSGVAVGDYDRDGRPDLFFCSQRGQNALFHNLGNWKFEEVSARVGINATNFV